MEQPRKPRRLTDNNKSDDEADYEVGYGKPPKSGQFKKGETGNPRGRPKKMKPRDPQDGDSYYDIMGRVLAMPVRVTKNNKTQSISSYEAVISQIQSQALGGDSKSLRLLHNHREKMNRILASRPQRQEILFFNIDHGTLRSNGGTLPSERSERSQNVKSYSYGAENDRILDRELDKLARHRQRETFDPVEALDNLLGQKFPATINGKKQNVTLEEASLLQTIKGALAGRPADMRSVLTFAELFARLNTSAVIMRQIIIPMDDMIEKI